MVLLPSNTDQPVVQEGQIRLTHSTHNEGVILCNIRSCFSEGVGNPLGFRQCTTSNTTETEETALWGLNPWEKNSKNDKESEEENKGSAVEEEAGLLEILG